MTQPHKCPALVRLPHCANQPFAQGAELLAKYPWFVHRSRRAAGVLRAASYPTRDRVDEVGVS